MTYSGVWEEQPAREAESAASGCCGNAAFDDIERLGEVLHYALQPIVSLHTGRCHGVEALLCGHQSLGFDAVAALLDAAHGAQRLEALEAYLRELAFSVFAQLDGFAANMRLFFNLDSRLLSEHLLSPQALVAQLERHGLSPEQLVLEISEGHELLQKAEGRQLLKALRQRRVRITIDDFGTGHAGLLCLHELRPDCLKIDRRFIAELDSEHRRKLFVSQMTSLAHTLGIDVIAEGVETEHEFRACREVGFDLVQGRLIQHPVTVLARLRPVYDHIVDLHEEREDRGDADDTAFLLEQMIHPPALRPEMLMTEVLVLFREYQGRSFFPVIDSDDRPLGVITEQALRSKIYSPFGHALLKRHRVADQLDQFMRPVPRAEIGAPLATLIDLYDTNAGMEGSSEGVFATRDGRYQGFWSAATLIRAVQRRDMRRARDENPLTGLPGNRSIATQVAQRLGSPSPPWCLVYFDLDNFKAFNDRYGFRQGDRVLMLFGQLLSAHFADSGCFVGHVGGDDFVLIMELEDYDAARARIAALQADLRREAQGFYDEATRQRGYLDGTDRFGAPRRFALLSVAAAALCLHPCRRSREEGDIEAFAALLKSAAKKSDSGLSLASLL